MKSIYMKYMKMGPNGLNMYGDGNCYPYFLLSHIAMTSFKLRAFGCMCSEAPWFYSTPATGVCSDVWRMGNNNSL